MATMSFFPTVLLCAMVMSMLMFGVHCADFVDHEIAAVSSVLQSYHFAYSVWITAQSQFAQTVDLDLSLVEVHFNGSILNTVGILSGGTQEELTANVAALTHMEPTAFARFKADRVGGSGPTVIFGYNQRPDRIRIYNRREDCCNQGLLKFVMAVVAHWIDPITNSSTPHQVWSMGFDEMIVYSETVPRANEMPLVFEAQHVRGAGPEFLDLNPNDVLTLPTKRPAAEEFAPSVYYFSRYSFHGQEEEVLKYFKYKSNGSYIDIGANDGVRHSNTFALEKYFSWSGLLVEPLARLLKPLVTNRSDRNRFLNACVFDRTHNAEFMETSDEGEFSGVSETWPWFHNNAYDSQIWSTRVPCFHIQDVLDAYGYTYVDYLSVDAEGADLIILNAIDWTRFTAAVVSVECHDNDENQDMQDALITLFFRDLRYSRMARFGWDLMFFK